MPDFGIRQKVIAGMNIFVFKQSALAPLAVVAMLLCSVTAAASSPAGVADALNNMTPAPDSVVPAHAKEHSGVLGDLNAGVLSARVVGLSLADGRTLQAHLQRVASDAAKGTQSWIGTFTDAPGSSLVVTKAAGAISGYANYNNETFELVPSVHGKHLLFALDRTRLPRSDGVLKAGGSAGDTLASSTTTASGTGTTATLTGSAVVQTVLVVYTAAAANTWGQATLQSMIQSAVQSANQAYLNSQVGITLNLVGLQQTSMTESGSGMIATLSNLISNSGIQTLRNNLGANMVVLVDQDSDWCGYSNLQITSLNGVTTTKANAVVYSSCLSSQALAHEIGHLQGLDHDRADATGSHFYAYSFGYRMCNSIGFKDIMSYPCSPDVPRILQFSNPNLYYNGYPTGISYQTNPTNSADAATSLNTSAAQVAAYSGTGSSSSTTLPAAPSGLTATGVAYNSVSLSWTDNATNATGYSLERSPDGVTFTQIASLGSGASSFGDVSVSASSHYYYRVRASNSAGFSSYSNTVGVTTPAVPPPPPPAPTSVAALNDGNGSATVLWASGGAGATSYVVQRQTWNARKGIWGSATAVGTVPSSVLSLIDQSGAGTYRYFVAAANSGGNSAAAGPAQVSVTSSTTTTTGKKH